MSHEPPKLGEHFLALWWGFAEVANDQVTVLAEVAEAPEEIDVEATRAERGATEEGMRTAAGKAFAMQRAQLSSAVTRITAASRR